MKQSDLEKAHLNHIDDFIATVKSVKAQFGSLPKRVLAPLDGAVGEATGHKTNIEKLADARSIMKKGKSRAD